MPLPSLKMMFCQFFAKLFSTARQQAFKRRTLSFTRVPNSCFPCRIPKNTHLHPQPFNANDIFTNKFVRMIILPLAAFKDPDYKAATAANADTACALRLSVRTSDFHSEKR
ncbi:hypothetical protein AAIH70_00475, partial [Neorhizobium sp. BT27B]|uniref:hypothetical protein n=1 Tax=Neorhizobium sp. BT27B TaxID=3142625 RepID=UPI003D2D9D91